MNALVRNRKPHFPKPKRELFFSQLATAKERRQLTKLTAGYGTYAMSQKNEEISAEIFKRELGLTPDMYVRVDDLDENGKIRSRYIFTETVRLLHTYNWILSGTVVLKNKQVGQKPDVCVLDVSKTQLIYRRKINGRWVRLC